MQRAHAGSSSLLLSAGCGGESAGGQYIIAAGHLPPSGAPTWPSLAPASNGGGSQFELYEPAPCSWPRTAGPQWPIGASPLFVSCAEPLHTASATSSTRSRPRGPLPAAKRMLPAPRLLADDGNGVWKAVMQIGRSSQALPRAVPGVPAAELMRAAHVHQLEFHSDPQAGQR